MWLGFRVVWFFFFKQKTAYEMRISDWSSDVCSSDLAEARDAGNIARAIYDIRGPFRLQFGIGVWPDRNGHETVEERKALRIGHLRLGRGGPGVACRLGPALRRHFLPRRRHRRTSQNHPQRRRRTKSTHRPAYIGRASCGEKVGKYG